MGMQERFWAKVDKTATCWLWMASKDRGGYGMFSVKRKPQRAHRVAYELLIGPIPDKHEIHHVCRVRACVNPDHLEVVTKREHPDAGPSLSAAKTQCPHGHPYTPENTFVRTDKNGRKTRKCRECLRAQWRRREQRRT